MVADGAGTSAAATTSSRTATSRLPTVEVPTIPTNNTTTGNVREEGEEVEASLTPADPAELGEDQRRAYDIICWHLEEKLAGRECAEAVERPGGLEAL